MLNHVAIGAVNEPHKIIYIIIQKKSFPLLKFHKNTLQMQLHVKPKIKSVMMRTFSEVKRARKN